MRPHSVNRLRYLLACGGLLLSGCGIGAAAQISDQVPGASPEHGRHGLKRYGCGGCHVIPGVPGAQGEVGPPLAGLANRSMIAGRLHTTPDNLAAWIQHPQQIAPGVDMPELGVSEVDARDMAAYLLTLK
jgi:cytochrome c